MPELPEVQTIVNTISPRLIGKQITHVDLRRRDIVDPTNIDLVSLLMDRKIERIWRRAKRIMIELEDGNRFYIHLGMSGRLMLEPADRSPAKHTHLILTIQDLRLHFSDPRRFGGIFWLGKGAEDDAELGPEPLEMQTAELARQLAKTTRAIKTALMDQSLIAGIGNIYADEALFDAKINPRRPANKLALAEVERLNRGIKEVLGRAIHHRGSTLRDYVDAEGGKGAFQKLHRVYGRTGLPCEICGEEIQKIVLGGRSTHFCKTCQNRGRAGPSSARNSGVRTPRLIQRKGMKSV